MENLKPAPDGENLETNPATLALEEAMQGYERPAAYGVGIATVSPAGRVLAVRFPKPFFHEANFSAALLASHLGYRSGTESFSFDFETLQNFADALQVAEIEASISQELAISHEGSEAARLCAEFGAHNPISGSYQPVAVFIDNLYQPPVDIADAYLRLHLLSYCKVLPNTVNLNGVFSLLNTTVWTDLGPFEPDDFEAQRCKLLAHGRTPTVHLIDKFPRMVDYVVPAGVRICDANRVRLGAHLAPGTVVMHEGFCNFNAGTRGNAMIEGRISQGVLIGEGSDLGGGASIMGTLSGGGSEVISVGQNCLIGANAGLGISLGDNCTVEAGLYLTAGTRVRMPDASVLKAKLLSGQNGLLFRRNSQNGVVEAIAKDKAGWQGLNTELHA